MENERFVSYISLPSVSILLFCLIILAFPIFSCKHIRYLRSPFLHLSMLLYIFVSATSSKLGLHYLALPHLYLHPMTPSWTHPLPRPPLFPSSPLSPLSSSLSSSLSFLSPLYSFLLSSLPRPVRRRMLWSRGKCWRRIWWSLWYPCWTVRSQVVLHCTVLLCTVRVWSAQWL